MAVNRKRCGFCQHENRADLEQALESRAITCDELDMQNGWRSGTAAQHQRNHMGDFEMSSNPKCAICVDPMRKHYEAALHNGEITSEAIAQALDTTKAQVQRHMCIVLALSLVTKPRIVPKPGPGHTTPKAGPSCVLATSSQSWSARR